MGTNVSDPGYWQLNAEQTGPFLDNGDCAVIACPGSGKTRLMMAKMVRLIEEFGVESVMAVTFTKAGTQEMRQRLTKFLGREKSKKAQIGTFHAFAYRQFKETLGGKKLEILREDAEQAVILRSRDRLGLSLDNETAIQMVYRIKRSLAERSEEHHQSAEETQGFDLFDDYRRSLLGMGAIDQDGLMPEVLRRYRMRGKGSLRPFDVQFVLADEYQDSDINQVRWLLAHAKAGAKITVVGDDDQSIYGFRNSLGVSGYRMLRDDLGEKSIRLYRLQTNYRCANGVVRAAGEVIEKNQDRVAKAFVAFQEETGVVRKRIYADRGEEAEAVVDYFERMGTEMAVLSRTKAWLAGVELVARSRGVPVKSVEKGSFLDQAHVRRVLLALSLGFNHENKVAFLEAAHAAGIYGKSLVRVEEKLRESGNHEDILDIIYRRDFLFGLEKDAATLFREFRTVVGNWCSACELCGDFVGENEEKMAAAIFRYGESFVDFVKNNDRRDDIRFLCEIIAKKMRGTIQERIEALMKAEKKDDGEPGLQLMTMHGSKGLEFPAVWIIGCSEGHLPKLEEGDDVEEERRLFYVAMTRAEKHLTVSAVRKLRNGREKNWEESRFLTEFTGDDDEILTEKPEGTLVDMGTGENDGRDEESASGEIGAKIVDAKSSYG